MREACSNCKSTDIELLTSKEELFVRNKHCGFVDVDYSVCAQCGYEIISTEQIKINDARIKEIVNEK